MSRGGQSTIPPQPGDERLILSMSNDELRELFERLGALDLTAGKLRELLERRSLDRWADFDEAALHWGVEKEYLQRNWKKKKYPFAKKISHKVVRFHLGDMDRWTRAR